MVDRFPVVLRGYDKERVDEAMLAAQNSIDRLREQVKAGDDTVLQLQAQLQEEKNRKANTDNSFASLGANAQQMLASAEQTSTELLERAKKDAASARTEAQSQSQTLVNNAKLDAQPPGRRRAGEGRHHSQERAERGEHHRDERPSGSRAAARLHCEDGERPASGARPRADELARGAQEAPRLRTCPAGA